ncbi:MAG: GrpB family protein [Candidatus Sumerlaeaceae bacterium]
MTSRPSLESISHPIAIVDPQPEWANEFHALAQEIERTLENLALRVDHIGSTSVPGLPAKDIIDVQVTVGTLIERDEIAARLQSIGYQLRADIVWDHVPPGFESEATEHWAKLFFTAAPDKRAAHVHVREHGRYNERYALLFRDYLRAHPDAAAAYGRVKRQLAAIVVQDRDAYCSTKDPICDLIMCAANEWQQARAPACGSV